MDPKEAILQTQEITAGRVYRHRQAKARRARRRRVGGVVLAVVALICLAQVVVSR